MIVQALWHLAPFRAAMLALRPGEVRARGGTPADVRVLTSLWDIFKAFEQGHSACGQGGAPAASAAGASTGGWAVSPHELRKALSELDGGSDGAGGASPHFELSDMHDAAEALGEIFNCLHRAELGAGASAVDPTLPLCIRMPIVDAPASWSSVLPSRRSQSTALRPQQQQQQQQLSVLDGTGPAPTPGKAGSVWSNSAALQKIK